MKSSLRFNPRADQVEADFSRLPERKEMKHWLRVVLMIGLAIATGCSRSNPKQAIFEETKRQGNYQLIASTTIDGDRIEFWKDSTESDDSCCDRFLMAAVDQSGDLLDFCAGEFVSSVRPFFQSPRYVALVASIGLGKEREVFFVYDAQLKKFFTHSVEEFVPHVHNNILIVGKVVFFASCKTTTPVGRLHLTTGQVIMFDNPEPQCAEFYLVGSDVLIKGINDRIYKVDGKKLIQVDTTISTDQITQMSFEKILIKREKNESKDALD